MTTQTIQHALSLLKWAYAWEISQSITKMTNSELSWTDAVDTWFDKVLISIDEVQVLSTWADQLSEVDLHPVQFLELMSTFHRWLVVIDEAWKLDVKEQTKLHCPYV